MNETQFNRYLEDRYYYALNFHHRAWVKNQKRHKVFQWTLIMISILTLATAILARYTASSTNQVIVNHLLVPLCSVVVILVILQKTFEYKRLQQNHYFIYKQLEAEQRYYLHNLGGYSHLGTQRESIFIERIENILHHRRYPGELHWENPLPGQNFETKVDFVTPESHRKKKSQKRDIRKKGTDDTGPMHTNDTESIL
jgi:hypothetical protein